MKIIILLLLSVSSFAQKGFFLKGDTLFLSTGETAIQLSRQGMAAGTRTVLDSVATALNGKANTSEIPTTTSQLANNSGYLTSDKAFINVQALTSSPADNQTIYFGMLPKAPITTANVSKVYFRQSGTITAAEIYCYSGTAGTAESWSIYVRKNNTTDYLIATVAAATNERVFSNSALNIPISANDYIEIKAVNPTWVTNPLTCIISGYIKIN
jgi:hypothetical protein